MSRNRNPCPWFVARDLDGFFGLFVDNLVQLLLIVGFCGACGIASDSPLLLDYILPGAAVSILAGNLFYAWQARRLAMRENRSNVTALPYGINTPSLVVFVFFVMLPTYTGAKHGGASDVDAGRAAWTMGLLACFGSGLIELAGSFVAERVRRSTPRAALLSTLAGVAIGFISMTFALRIFQRPLVGMLPLAIILITYFSGVQFPLSLPGGLLAVLAGTACAWIGPLILPASVAGPSMDAEALTTAYHSGGWHFPRLAAGELFSLIASPGQWVGYLSVIVPMGLFNVIGSLQNLESASASGDDYATRPSMAVNGIGTLTAALLGSCFPTTIYIGHPGWKALGARAGYSTLNGLIVSLICLTGTVTLISRVVPVEAGVAIMLWIGVIITAQAFQSTPQAHAPAVAVGLFPAIAAWGATIVQGAFERSGGLTIEDLLKRPPISPIQGLPTEVNGFLLHGMLVLERGSIFTCMILAAICVCLIDRRFRAAGFWSLIGAALAFLGLTHAYRVSGNLIDHLFLGADVNPGATAFRATGVALGYLLFAAVFFAFRAWYRPAESAERRIAGNQSGHSTQKSASRRSFPAK